MNDTAIIGTIYHDRKWWQFKGKVDHMIYYGDHYLTFSDREERDKAVMMILEQEKKYAVATQKSSETWTPQDWFNKEA